MDTNLNVSSTGTEENKKKKVVPIIVIIIILILACLLGYRYWLNNRDSAKLQAAVSAQLGMLENKTEAEVEAELNRVVADGSMIVSINASPVFRKGNEQGTLMIENSPANKYSQNVIIQLKETGEVIYESGLLAPNYHITGDYLKKSLPKGEHECSVTFIGYDTSDANNPFEVGRVNADIKINVLT